MLRSISLEMTPLFTQKFLMRLPWQKMLKAFFMAVISIRRGEAFARKVGFVKSKLQRECFALTDADYSESMFQTSV